MLGFGMKSLSSKYFMVFSSVLLLTLTGCGSSDQQQGATTTAGSSPVVLTAQDVAMTTAIGNAVASQDANAPAIAAAKAAALATANPATSAAVAPLAKTVSPPPPVVGEQKVFSKSIFVVPKSGTISFSKSFNGLADGAQGTLVFLNSFGTDIPTTACTGTAKQIKVCQASRSIALAWNPTSVQVVLNGTTVIAPNQIPRTQGKALIPATVKKANTMQVTISGPAYSFIQLEVWSQPTAPVAQSPIANFTFNPTSGTVPVNIAFDASTSNSPNGAITNYSWDFGDGATGTGITISHFYSFASTFSIVLTVTDSAGKSATKSSSIVIANPILPVPSFTYTIDPSGTLKVNVDGSGSSSANGPISVYYWNWGDGVGATFGVTSSYTYAAAGTYLVTLTVTDVAGVTASIGQTITIQPGPVANFTFNPPSGTVPVNITFDASTSSSPNGAITNYSWDFGDGSTGSGITPSHQYLFAGTFSIVLTVTDSAGLSATKSAAIVIANPIPPVASFTYNIDTSGVHIVSVDGSGSSSVNGSISIYSWNWGDGIGLTTGVTSSYTYATAGSYVVTLTVIDAAGNIAAISQTVTVP